MSEKVLGKEVFRGAFLFALGVIGYYNMGVSFECFLIGWVLERLSRK